MNTHVYGAGDPGAAAIRKQRQADARAKREKQQKADNASDGTSPTKG